MTNSTQWNFLISHQYGFELHEGIFRIKDGEMNIDHDELKRYVAMGGLFEANAKEMSQVFWFVSRFVNEQSDLNEESEDDSS